MRYGWSLDAEPWNKLRARIVAFEWRRVFLEEDYVSQVPSSSGVYLICASPRSVLVPGRVMELLYNTIYVGQSRNLRARCRNHVIGYGSVRTAKLTFGRLDFWYSELAPNELSDVEQLLLEALGPTANMINVRAKVGEPVPAG